MEWITGKWLEIDRIVCPSLIKIFPDTEAKFTDIPKKQVFEKARKLNDIPGAAYTHEGDYDTFDYSVKKHHLTGPAIQPLAATVPGADSGSFNLSPQTAGHWAISARRSYNYRDNHEELRIGINIYHALYSRAKYVQ